MHLLHTFAHLYKAGRKEGERKKEGGIKREGKPPALAKTLAIRTGYEHGLRAKNNGKCWQADFVTQNLGLNEEKKIWNICLHVACV